MEDYKKPEDQLKEELEHLEEANVDELTDGDLESVAGGEVALEEGGDCSSVWCCSNG